MKLSVNGHPVFAATAGRDLDPGRPTIVFLHGAAMDHSVWALPVRFFVRHGCNVLALDLPGHGRSQGPPLASVEQMAQWLLAVMAAAGIDRAALVGHSLGALVVLDLAARFPARARALVLLGASAPMPVSEQLLSAAREDRHDGFDMVTIWGHSFGSQLGGFGAPGMWMPGGGLRLLEQSARGVLYADLSACNAYTAGLERAATLDCPTLLILGERDQMTPARAGRRLADAIPGAECIVLAGCGHLLMAERPNEVLDALIAGTAPDRHTETNERSSA